MTPQPPDAHQDGQVWPYDEAGRYVEAAGVRWHLLHLGTGPPVLLLHGSASSTHAWAGVVRGLRHRYSFMIPDLPGHGHSSALPASAGGTTALARAVGALVEALGVSPTLVAGHSAGAVLAIRAAHRGWIRPLGILGVNPALGSREAFLPQGVAAPLLAVARTGLTARAGAGLFRALPLARLLLGSTGSRVDAAVAARYRHLLSRPERVRGVLQLMAGWDPGGAGEEAAALGIPVHYLTAENDRWVPPTVVRAHAAGLPVEAVPGRGHLLPEEDPGAVVAAFEALAAETGV